MQGEEGLRPFAFTPVCVGVQGDFHSWAGRAGRGVPHECVLACHVLKVSMMRATVASTGEAIMPATPAHVMTSDWTMAPIMRSVKPNIMHTMDVMAVFSCRVERRSRRLSRGDLCIIASVCVCESAGWNRTTPSTMCADVCGIAQRQSS